jgi:fumigallin biosynthesis monooxygenase-like protein
MAGKEPMAPIFTGRYTAHTDEPFVVFLIGMRVNRIFALRRWTRVAAAMPPLIAELKRHPELGLLRVETAVYWRGVVNIMYWRSFEHLHAFAHMRDGLHLPAWAEFNRRVGTDGSVGIWHETYMVERGQYECIYANMPRFGFAHAVSHRPITGRLESARNRIGAVENVESAAGVATAPGDQH